MKKHLLLFIMSTVFISKAASAVTYEISGEEARNIITKRAHTAPDGQIYQLSRHNPFFDDPCNLDKIAKAEISGDDQNLGKLNFQCVGMNTRIRTTLISEKKAYSYPPSIADSHVCTEEGKWYYKEYMPPYFVNLGDPMELVRSNLIPKQEQ